MVVGLGLRSGHFDGSDVTKSIEKDIVLLREHVKTSPVPNRIR